MRDRWFLVTASGTGVIALTCWLAAAGVSSVAGVPLFVKTHDAYRIAGLYATGGVLEHALTAGTQMVFGIVSAYVVLDRRQRGAMVVVILVCAVALVLSMARGAWLAMAAGALYGLAAQRRVLQVRLFSALLAAIIAGIAYIGYEIVSGTGILASALRLDMGMSNRETVWPLAVWMISQQPWTGYGYGASTEVKEALVGLGFHVGATDSGFHNSLLDTAVSSGAIIAAIYTLLFLVPVYRAARARIDRRLRQTLVAASVASFISVVFVAYNIGGARITSLTLTTLLGLANLTPLIEEIQGDPPSS